MLSVSLPYAQPTNTVERKGSHKREETSPLRVAFSRLSAAPTPRTLHRTRRTCGPPTARLRCSVRTVDRRPSEAPRQLFVSGSVRVRRKGPDFRSHCGSSGLPTEARGGTLASTAREREVRLRGAARSAPFDSLRSLRTHHSARSPTGTARRPGGPTAHHERGCRGNPSDRVEWCGGGDSNRYALAGARDDFLRTHSQTTRSDEAEKGGTLSVADQRLPARAV
jgi:hypothetical protein